MAVGGVKIKVSRLSNTNRLPKAFSAMSAVIANMP
jgi:hypothetical protein